MGTPDRMRLTDALLMAWFGRKSAVGLRHHSDRGSQYVSQPFQTTLKSYVMDGAMSRKRNCLDYAPAKSWCNSFNNERAHGRHDAIQHK